MQYKTILGQWVEVSDKDLPEILRHRKESIKTMSGDKLDDYIKTLYKERK